MMKNITLFLLTIISLFACTKSGLDREAQSFTSKNSNTALATATQGTTSLYIPEDEGGWNTWYPSGRVGLFNAYKQISFTTVNQYLSDAYGGTVPIGTIVKQLNYDCLIANGIRGESWDTTVNNPITITGNNDFVVNADGSQSMPLEITTYAQGDVYLGRKKDEFDYTPTDNRTGVVKGTVYHGQDFIWWGWGDTYYNSAIVPPADGLYVIAVTLDYGKINPNSSLLPIRITGNTVVTDTTAIVANTAQRATNYKAVLQRGKLKGVNITWQGKGYAYCIERDGQMILRWFDGRSFFDAEGNRFSKYKIITRAQGRIPDNETPVFSPTK